VLLTVTALGTYAGEKPQASLLLLPAATTTVAIVIFDLDDCVATEVNWYIRMGIRPFTAKEAGSALLLLHNNLSTVLGFGLPVSWVYTAQQYRVIPRTLCTGTD